MSDRKTGLIDLEMFEDFFEEVIRLIEDDHILDILQFRKDPCLDEIVRKWVIERRAGYSIIARRFGLEWLIRKKEPDYVELEFEDE